MRIGNVPRSRARTGLAAAAVAAAVLAGAAGCTGSSTAGTTSPGTGAGTSSGPGGTVTLPPASASATATTTSADTGAGGNTANASGIPSCGDTDIAVSLGRAGAASNHAAQPVLFKNVSGHACTLQGYPGAAVVAGGRTLVNASRVLNGYIGYPQQLGAPPVVTLQPGQSATGMLEWEKDAGEKCYPDGSGSLVMTPPNTTKSTSLTPITVGTMGMCAGFEVHPVVPGIVS